jgi:hypothetical protein
MGIKVKQLLLDPDAIAKQKQSLERGFTIKDIVNNLSQKYIGMKEMSCMTPEALRNPLTKRMFTLPMNESRAY